MQRCVWHVWHALPACSVRKPPVVYPFEQHCQHDEYASRRCCTLLRAHAPLQAPYLFEHVQQGLLLVLVAAHVHERVSPYQIRLYYHHRVREPLQAPYLFEHVQQGLLLVLVATHMHERMSSYQFRQYHPSSSTRTAAGTVPF
jgi:hypothetical protein